MTQARARPEPGPAPALAAPGSLLTLPGIGPARAARLSSAGIATLRDLLLCVPAEVQLSRVPVPIRAALARRGERLSLAGEVRSWRFSRFGRRSLLRVSLDDASGSIDLLFFNQPWLRERFKKGERLEVEGRVVDARGPALAVSRLASPGRPLPAPGSLVVTYAAPKGIPSELLRSLAEEAARRHARELEEPLDAATLARHSLPALGDAVPELCVPSSIEAFERARRRVALETLLALQATLAARRLDMAGGRAPELEVSPGLRDELVARFPYALTAAQARAIEEIRSDIARRSPMRRLLQGDVGSGKTAVGAWACLAAAAAGFQAAFMAPTELLAEQHLGGLEELLARGGVRAELLTGSLAPAARAAAQARVESGEAQVVFGTHALFSEGVAFARLALAVIDEQHRFGVAQRRALYSKGRDVHALLMTATPIPRSLALTLYGDLDLSLLDEKPPGRGAVRTRWLRGGERRSLEGLLEQRLSRGGLAFWVVPRIENRATDPDDEGERDCGGAQERFQRLTLTPLARHGLELVHGGLRSEERSRRLARFRSGEARLLVATTVIEVGVDVPAAGVIVIEQAHRLGLAQLHQLRGRVGRGPQDAECFLLGGRAAEQRFRFLERSGDGFEIAEEDLRRRGMGELAGLRQAGPAGGGLADPGRDLQLLLLARDLVRERADLRERYRCLAP